MDQFVSNEDISNYATIEQLNNISRMLSRVMTGVIPSTIVRVEQGTEESDIVLPSSMTVTFSDGSYFAAPVAWNTYLYDKALVGYQYIEGTLNLPAYVVNKEDIVNLNKCYIIIQVYEPQDTPVVEDKPDVSGFGETITMSVPAGTAFSEIRLPTYVYTEVMYASGETGKINLDVVWDTEDVPEIIYGALVITGTVTTGEDITNLIDLQPKVNIITTGSGTPKYEYRDLMFLDAGETNLSGGYIPSITTDLLYGVGLNLNQRKVDLRFLGFVDSNDNNLIEEFTQTYPDGIRVPVYTSVDADVNAYLAAIKVVSDQLGYPIEYDIPGGAVNPRITLDDETHKIIFNSPSPYKAKFLLSKSKDYNLPYPDID
jgi:hypothetical protein